MATIDEQIGNVRKVFGDTWSPSVNQGLIDQGVLGAVRIKGSNPVYTIGEGGREETADSYRQRFGTDSQEGIVGEITPEQAAALGITPQITSINKDDMSLTNRDISQAYNDYKNQLVKSNADLEALRNDQTIKDLQAKALGYYTPTENEVNLENAINTKTEGYNQAATDIEKNILGIEGQGRGITTGLVRGQQEKLYKQGQLSLATLQNEINGLTARLTTAQKLRTNKLNAANAAVGYEQDNRTDQQDLINAVSDNNKAVMELFEKYNTFQKEQFESLMTKLQGVDPSKLDAITLNKISNLASSMGITGSDAVKALQAQYDSYILDLSTKQNELQKSKNNIQVMDIGGDRYVVTYDNAGNVTKKTKLGSASGPLSMSEQLALKEAGYTIDSSGKLSIDTSSATADMIAQAIKQVESGGNYNAKGGSGEGGAYQFMPATWNSWSSKYANEVLKKSVASLPMTQENQDAVAKWKIQSLLNQGYNAQQIASIWNSGGPEWEGKTGTNKYGVKYDVPGYVNKVTNALGNIMPQSPTGQSEESSISDYQTERARRTIQSVDNLMKKANGWTTGYGSWLSSIPTTDARNFKAELDTLKSNIAFSELTAMREASKTGGALGQVSDREGKLLESALGALDAGQSPENFKKNLQQIKDSINSWITAASGSNAGGNDPLNLGISGSGDPLGLGI